MTVENYHIGFLDLLNNEFFSKLSEGTVGQYEALYKVFPILQKLTHSDGFKFFIICSSGAKLKYFRPELLPMGLRETLVIEFVFIC